MLQPSPEELAKRPFVASKSDLYENQLQQCRRSQEKLQSLKDFRRQTNFPDLATDEKGSETVGHGDP